MNRSWIRAFYAVSVLMFALISRVRAALCFFQLGQALLKIPRRPIRGRARKVGLARGVWSFSHTAFGLGLALLVSACNPAGDTVIGSNFYPGVTLSLSNSTVSSASSTVLSGNSILVTVSLKDTDGNPFVSTLPVVSLQTSGGMSTGIFSSVTNNGDGTYSSTFSAVGAGTATMITPLVDGSVLTSALPLLTVVSGNFSLAQSLLTLSSGSVVSGSQVTVTLTVKDSSGNLSTSGGLNVVFSNSGGTSTGFFSAVTDNQNGTYTSTFTGGVGGTATTIFATIEGSSVTSSLPALTVIDQPPTGLTYSANPATYIKGSAITSNTPFSAGGPVDGYTISPALPAGLTFNGGTGAISGTPTNITTAANYTVTASNTGGSVSAVVSIAVNDVAPSLLTYSANSATYTKGSSITNNTPSNSGGSVLSYAISPAVPMGLNFSVITGILSGTPSVVSAATNYAITATNSGGSTTASISVGVIDVAPTNLSYTVNNPVYTKGTTIALNSPSSLGGAITSYSVSPALPPGLNFNTTTGAITGAATIVSAATGYTVTAGNSGGTITASITITVQDIAPTSFTYANNPVTLTKGSSASDAPSNSGGAVTSYSVSPALPAGLSLNTTTGVISGTPTGFTSTATYTVTATNTGGTTNVSLSLTINDIAPSALTYSTSPAVYTKGSAITNNTPANSGGAVVSYAISPGLPAGLNLSTTTGIISGTATAISGTTSYTVTATNSGGSTSATLSITVNDIPPSTLTYGTNPATYTVGSVIAANTTSNSGGVITGYSVSPALPAGLNLNSSTGTVSGTPSAITANATYTVTGVSSGGNVTASLIITVNDVAPSALTYLATSPVYSKNSAITPDTVTSSGGAVTSFSVSPSLPLGLSLNTSTGTISGTPTSVGASSSYIVTAINSGGSTTATVAITVTDVAPSSLTYGTSAPTYTKGLAISPDSPSSGGGAVVSYAIAPALPAGLSFSTSTGVISGTATIVSAATSYTVTATNTGGSTTTTLSVTVNDVVASNLVYSGDPATYTKGTAISSNTPSSSGGAVTSYSVSPALPTGLNFNTSSGAITGTPSVISPATNYTITATNSGGSVTDSVSITVNDVMPSALSYSSNPATYIKGTAITNNIPTISGGAITAYSVSPSLPGGLSLNTSTGVISGTPTIYTSTASYVVSATNSGGSTSVSVSILVKDVPLLSYAGATGTSGTVGSAMTVNPTTFSAQGAAITGCAVKASTTALPVWATLSTSTCVISGTPTAGLASTTYTIDAINSAGTSLDATVSLSVVYPVPTLTSITPNSGTRNGGTSVVIAGTGFYSGVAVTLGGNACTSLVVNSTTQITCTTPAHTIGTADVVVTNPGVAAATLTGGFTFTSVAFTQNWDFNTASQYTYDNTKISFTGGFAELTSSNQVDNSSNCTTGFGDGVTPSCGGTSTGTIFTSATDGLGGSNYMVLSHAGTATDLELDSSWAPDWPHIIGYWKLNGTVGAIASGATFPDSSSAGTATGSTLAATSYVAGKLNQGIFLTGAEALQIPANVAPNPCATITVSLWFNSTTFNGGGVIGKDGYSTSSPGWLIQGASSQSMNLRMDTSAGSQSGGVWKTTDNFFDGNWHHVAFTINGPNVVLYKDGIQDATGSFNQGTGFCNSVQPIYIGESGVGTKVNGTYDDIAIWSTALPASAIATIYQHESAAHAGTLTSRVMDGLSSNSWTSLALTTTLPFEKELPDTATASPSPTPTSESQISYSSQSANLLSGGSGVTGQLVGLWHLDEAAGTTGTGSVLDRSGQGNNGTPAAGVIFGVTGEFGGAAQFSGSNANGYITAASTNLPIGASSVSIALGLAENSRPSL